MPLPFPLGATGHPPLGQRHGLSDLSAHIITPVKRLAKECDDEVEFISEQPVKRYRAAMKHSALPNSPPHDTHPSASTSALVSTFTSAAAAAATTTTTTGTSMNNAVENTFDYSMSTDTSIAAMLMSGSDLRNTERRLSTGMVGLPSDLHAIELSYALRGVSMPVLEKFTFNQPRRRPRTLSPPELSPKQLSNTVSSAAFGVQTSQTMPTAYGPASFQDLSAIYQNSTHTSCPFGRPTTVQGMMKVVSVDKDHHAIKTNVDSNCHSLSTSPSQENIVGSASTAMPPPTFPCPKHPPFTPYVGNGSGLLGTHHQHHHPSPSYLSKQPCQLCSRLVCQAHLSRAKGFLEAQATLPSRFIPQLHYHPPCSLPLPHQTIPTPPSSLHQLGQHRIPTIVSANVGPIGPPPTYPQLQPNPQEPKEAVDKEPAPNRAQSTESPHMRPKATNAAPSPVRPPMSLIHFTYRKPSPNLIVDVAETCQSKFPFEEVAKRHNVPMDKVFEIFSAIIQVPLLRCPTDRRRPGRLATARIKEYSKAKGEICNAAKAADGGGGDGGSREGDDGVVDPVIIAQRLGRIEFPEGFTLGGKS